MFPECIRALEEPAGAGARRMKTPRRTELSRTHFQFEPATPHNSMAPTWAQERTGLSWRRFQFETAGPIPPAPAPVKDKTPAITGTFLLTPAPPADTPRGRTRRLRLTPTPAPPADTPRGRTRRLRLTPTPAPPADTPRGRTRRLRLAAPRSPVGLRPHAPHATPPATPSPAKVGTPVHCNTLPLCVASGIPKTFAER